MNALISVLLFLFSAYSDLITKSIGFLLPAIVVIIVVILAVLFKKGKSSTEIEKKDEVSEKPSKE